jgi:poly(glycerol-phosphate) alpha-glucosyltransferase
MNLELPSRQAACAQNVEAPVSSVVHVTSWLSRQGGGIPPVVWALAGAMQQRGVKTSVMGLQDQWVAADCANYNLPFVAGKLLGPSAFGYSPDLMSRMRSDLQPSGIVHSHGLWMYPGVAARKCAAQTGSPLVISPHGMLEPWAMNNSRSKKRLAGWLFENKNLRAADCLHALCAAEANHFRSLGLTNPIAIMPNGVDLKTLQPLPDRDDITERFPELKNRRRVLFLARLHPKKGLENLLRAWQKAGTDSADWCLMIAGSGDPVYEEQLRALVRDFSLGKNVFFLGPVYGSDKARALAAADVFVLPSFSEGFSMAILEAAAVGLPVLLTPECNFPELVTAGAALEMAAEVEGITLGLKQMLKFSDDQRIEMGRRGMKLVEQSYTWSAITRQMLETYQWLAGKGTMPKFVQLK